MEIDHQCTQTDLSTQIMQKRVKAEQYVHYHKRYL